MVTGHDFAVELARLLALLTLMAAYANPCGVGLLAACANPAGPVDQSGVVFPWIVTAFCYEQDALVSKPTRCCFSVLHALNLLSCAV